jgi:hypothetical protein
MASVQIFRIGFSTFGTERLTNNAFACRSNSTQNAYAKLRSSDTIGADCTLSDRSLRGTYRRRVCYRLGGKLEEQL